MFVVVTGKPGSGKSAYGVNLVLSKKDEYRDIYSNINGLKMGGNIKALNFNRLKEIITDCKNIYDYQISKLGEVGNINVIDEPILEYLLSVDFIEYNKAYDDYLEALKVRKSKNILLRLFLDIFKKIIKVPKYKPNLFLIDEAQNHLPSIDLITGKTASADPVLVWWVSYHRHLYMDVILLTQQYQKLHSSYLRDVQFFLNAVDADNTILGDKTPYFKYIKHMSTPFFKTNKAGFVKVNKTKKLFNLYESGDKVRTKSAVLPYIYLALFLLVVAGGVFSYAIDSLGSGEHVDDNSSMVSDSPIDSRIIRNVKQNTFSNEQFFYIKLNCIAETCINKEHKININVDDLNTTLSTTKSKILTVSTFGEFYGSITLLVTSDFIKLFQGVQNVKNNKNFSLLN